MGKPRGRRERLRTVHVQGLSLGATHELLRNRLDATFARPVLIKLWEASGGNPFFALELGAALQRRGGTLDAGEDLPIPTALDQLLHVRLDSLGPRPSTSPPPLQPSPIRG